VALKDLGFSPFSHTFYMLNLSNEIGYPPILGHGVKHCIKKKGMGKREGSITKEINLPMKIYRFPVFFHFGINFTPITGYLQS
jgi:hypothetical protein